MIFLLDAHVLIALLVADRVHHDAAESWAAGHSDPVATCPITQGSLIRLVMRDGQSAATAHALLSALIDNERHEFWPDDAAYRDVRIPGQGSARSVAGGERHSGVQHVQRRTLPAGVRVVERASPVQAELVAFVPVARPDRAGVVEDELTVSGPPAL